MKIICAPDSFKETLRASDAASAMARGIQSVDPAIEIDLCPIGDGGEGTMDALLVVLGGTVHTVEVTGPCGDPVQARYSVTSAEIAALIDNPSTTCRSKAGPTAIVELAEASGLALVPHHRRDPTNTTTFGTGEIIRHAIQGGCDRILLCVGGSATIDGGIGIIQALGGTFWDTDDNLITAPMCGGVLKNVRRFKPPPKQTLRPITVAYDVVNPLCGRNGAASVYGPQKGASRQQVLDLDAGLLHLASILGGDPNVPGSGAAGGAAFGLRIACNATMSRGVDLVLKVIEFDARCEHADLVLTGEGQLDYQSLHGKACMGVAAAAARLRVPTIAIVGVAGRDCDACIHPAQGGWLKEFFSLANAFGVSQARNEPQLLVEQATVQLVKKFIASQLAKA